MLLFVMLCWLALFMALAPHCSAVCFCPKFRCTENVILLGCKRSPFEVQNESFWNAKRVLLVFAGFTVGDRCIKTEAP